MIAEGLTLWLMVYAYDPESGNEYTIADEQIPIVSCETSECIRDKCFEAQQPWIDKALKVTRGNWILKPACQLEHTEGQIVSLKSLEKKKGKNGKHKR